MSDIMEDADSLARYNEECRRLKEREAQRELGLRLIDIGYKTLRKQLRPIKGKPEPWERQLREVRRHLKANV